MRNCHFAHSFFFIGIEQSDKTSDFLCYRDFPDFIMDFI